MHTIAALGALCLRLASQLVNATPVRHAVRQEACSPGIHMIVAGGNGTTNNAGLLQSLVDSVTSSYPGSDTFLPPYDGSATPAAGATSGMLAEVQSYSSSCPGTPIALLGYSLGGIVVMNTVCGGVPFQSNIIAAIAYGEETRVAGQSYNQGTCTSSAPQYARADPSTCQPFAAQIQDFCVAEDPQCCVGGSDGDSHFTYATNYDSQSKSFIDAAYGGFSARR